MHLPKVTQRKNYEIGKLVQLLMNIHKDIYLNLNDIEVEYYDSWDFYKVSIFRYSECGAGKGNEEYRDLLWENTQDGMLDLFDMKLLPDFTWRWKSHPIYMNREIETLETGAIPGVTYWILCS